MRSTIRALLSSGRRWRVALSISASRSGSRRSASPAIATAKRLIGRRESARCLGGGIERLAAAKHGVEHLQRGSARARPSTLGIGRPDDHLGPMKRPKHLEAARLFVQVAAGARAEPGARRPPAGRRKGSIRRATATGKRRASRSISRCTSARGGRASNSPSTWSTLALAGEQCIDRRDDRHVDALLLRQPRKHRRGEGAFGDGPPVGQQFGGGAALANALAERDNCASWSTSRSARGRRDRIGRPAFRASRRSARPKRVISAKPRAISAARAFWPSPLPSTTPQAIASTFLTAPPISAPATSSLRVDAEGRLGDPVAQLPRQRLVLGGERHRGRQAGGDFVRECRARQHGDRRVRAGLVRDLVEQLRRSFLDALGAQDQRRRSAGAASSTARICWAGVTTSHASQSSSSARSPVARIAGSSLSRAGRPDSRGPR